MKQKSKKIVVVGGGNYAKIVMSILKKNNSFEIVGYTDKKNRGKILDIKYLGDDSVLKKLLTESNVKLAAIGVGATSKCRH